MNVKSKILKKLSEVDFMDYNFDELIEELNGHKNFDCQQIFQMKDDPSEFKCESLRISNLYMCIPQIKLMVLSTFQLVAEFIRNLEIKDAVLSFNELKNFMEMAGGLESLKLDHCKIIEVFEVDSPSKPMPNFKNLFILNSEINFRIFQNCKFLEVILVENYEKSMSGFEDLLINSTNLEILCLKNVNCEWKMGKSKISFKLKYLLFDTPISDQSLNLINQSLQQKTVVGLMLKFTGRLSTEKSESLFERIVKSEVMEVLMLGCPGLQFDSSSTAQVFQLKNPYMKVLTCFHPNSGILAKMISAFPCAEVLNLKSKKLSREFSWRHDYMPKMDSDKLVKFRENPIIC